MRKNKKQHLEEEKRLNNDENNETFLKEKNIKDLIAPSGIDVSNIDHLEIISSTKRFARSFFVSSLPRMCTFPELFRDMYLFGDINTSIYINPIREERSQNELNRVINELETERIVAMDKGNINRESTISQKRLEAIKEFTELGSGYKLAMRDLSIRGAGDLLGSEQAGFIDSVGVDMYLELVNEEINNKEEEKNDIILDDVETHIDKSYSDEEDVVLELTVFSPHVMLTLPPLILSYRLIPSYVFA